MTDPNPSRRGAPPALEPWALDLLEQEGLSSPVGREETARVVALLRELDRPPRDPERVERLLRRLAEERARPIVSRIAFGAARRIARPPVSLALAAGIAAVLAVGVAPDLLLAPGGGGAPEPAAAPVTVAASTPGPTAPPAPLRRRTTPVIRPQLVNVSAFSPPSLGQSRSYHHPPTDLSFVRGLDRQLNQLLIDPDAFASGLERVARRDRLIGRLAERAAERGDGVEIALRVRDSRHPLARAIVERMLHATLVARVSGR